MTDELREAVAEVIADVFYSADDGGGGYDAEREYADRILAIPAIKEALNFHEACQKAFAVNGEFVVTEKNVRGNYGVSAS